MDIFSVFTLCGGLAFFLYGMHVMSSGLEKMSGGKLESSLKKMTSKPFASLALGAGITIVIQSSSALTVMLVGLVNSGIMNLNQTIGVIMGSNIGTTSTAWLMALSGNESEVFLLKLLKPESFTPILALAGIIMIMLAKSSKKKDLGSILVGFAVLMTGMDLMKNSVAPLADMPEFKSILTAFSNPVLGVAVGAIFTGIIQSSAASVAILQALSMTGTVTYGAAIPIIMGQNIGTCVTAIISSIGVNKNAKRVAVVHISFNMIGTIVCLAVMYGLNAFLDFVFLESLINPVGVAFCHTVFNVTCTALLLPFSNQLLKLANNVIKDKPEDDEPVYEFLDERLLMTPSFAIAQCRDTTVKMSKIAKKALFLSLDIVKKYDPQTANRIVHKEQKLDMYEDKLGSFLVKLSSKELSKEDSEQAATLLQIIGDLERIGDHAVNVMDSAKEVYDKKIDFSNAAKAELAVSGKALREIINISFEAFANNDIEMASEVEPLEQVIDDLISDMRKHHVDRLQKGECTIELGFVWSDILVNYERISDHCSNLAIHLIQGSDVNIKAHSYMENLKDKSNTEFYDKYNNYKEKYNFD